MHVLRYNYYYYNINNKRESGLGAVGRAWVFKRWCQEWHRPTIAPLAQKQISPNAHLEKAQFRTSHMLWIHHAIYLHHLNFVFKIRNCSLDQTQLSLLIIGTTTSRYNFGWGISLDCFQRLQQNTIVILCL